MTTIKCSGEGCVAVFETSEPVSPNAKYTCKVHTPKSKDKARFQSHQFERDLSRAGKPLGTNHIPHQTGTGQPQGYRPTRALIPGTPEGTDA